MAMQAHGRGRSSAGNRPAVQRSLRVVADDDMMPVLALAQRSDIEALSILYRKYVGLVFGYLRVNDCPRVEDATSEVFLKMVRSISKFSGDESDFRRWLMTITHNQMIDERRRLVRRPREDPIDDKVLEVERLRVVDGASVDALVVDQELSEAVGGLTEAQREVIGLRFIADLSMETTAQITGRSMTSVKAIQRRALASLRRTMKPSRELQSMEGC